MGVYYSPDNFPRRRTRGKYGSIFLPQRLYNAFKVQPASRPPCPYPANRVIIAAHIISIPSDNVLYSLGTVPFVREHHIRQFMMDYAAALTAQPPDNQRFLISRCVDNFTMPAADDTE